MLVHCGTQNVNIGCISKVKNNQNAPNFRAIVNNYGFTLIIQRSLENKPNLLTIVQIITTYT